MEEFKVYPVSCPVEGEVIPLSQVSDTSVAYGMLGPGVGIHPAKGRVVAPFAGEVSALFDTKHAIGLTSDDGGVEVLIHVGINTVELNGKYYYFDKTGVQHTGWQKMRGDYYFFRIENGEKGYMVTSKKVNGVTLQYNGKAKKTKKNIEKLKTMLKANKFLEKATKPTMKKYDKLKSCFQYSIENFKYRGSPRFVRSKNWENKYALDMFDKGHGNCYAYGAAFAFLANAAGYTDVYAISSGGHGWAEVKGKVFDPSWEIVDKKHHYFNMSYKLSGKDGRPNYKKHRRYAKKI